MYEDLTLESLENILVNRQQELAGLQDQIHNLQGAMFRGNEEAKQSYRWAIDKFNQQCWGIEKTIADIQKALEAKRQSMQAIRQ